MSYARNIEATACCDPKELRGCEGPEKEPLVELMNGTKDVGLAIAGMAERIEANLFGRSNSPHPEAKEASPMCHWEALEQHRRTLCDAADTLSRICVMLGI